MIYQIKQQMISLCKLTIRYLPRSLFSPFKFSFCQMNQLSFQNEYEVKSWYQHQLQKLQSQSDQGRHQRIRALTKEYALQLQILKLTRKQSIVKEFLLKHMPTQKPKRDSLQPVYIPNGLTIQKLFTGVSPSGKQGELSVRAQGKMLLIGVERDNDEHCIFTKRICQQLLIKNILTTLPPDLPYFIKTQQSYIQEWRQFLHRPTDRTKFFLNPNPKRLSEIGLNRSHIPAVRKSMSRSRSFLQGMYWMMQHNPFTNKFQYNALLSGLVTNGVQNVYFCDYPAIKERQLTANTLTMDEARTLFQQYVKNLKENRLYFSPSLMLPKPILKAKFAHIVSIAKTVSYEIGKTNTPYSLLVCPTDIAEQIAKEWKINNRTILNYNAQVDDYFIAFADYAPKEQTFVQFIEKLVILDLVLEPIIMDYYVKYDSFPYLCQHTVGGQENLSKVFQVWSFFRKRYYPIIEKVLLSQDKLDVSSEKKSQFETQHQHF